MPCRSLGNLPESIFAYWLKMTKLVREMITWETKKTQTMLVNGQKVPHDQAQARKYKQIMTCI